MIKGTIQVIYSLQDTLDLVKVLLHNDYSVTITHQVDYETTGYKESYKVDYSKEVNEE